MNLTVQFCKHCHGGGGVRIISKPHACINYSPLDQFNRHVQTSNHGGSAANFKVGGPGKGCVGLTYTLVLFIYVYQLINVVFASDKSTQGTKQKEAFVVVKSVLCTFGALECSGHVKKKKRKRIY